MNSQTDQLLSAALALFSLSQEPLARSLLGAMGVGIAVGGITGNVNHDIPGICRWRCPVELERRRIRRSPSRAGRGVFDVLQISAARA